MTVDIQAVPAPRSARFRVRDTESEMTTAKAPVAPVPVKKIPANSNRKLDFKANDHVVYPTHGVGRINDFLAGLFDEKL